MEINQQISKVLNDTFDRTIQLVSGVSPEIINEKTQDESWTIGQIVEHILICSSGIPDSQTEEISRSFDEQVPIIREIFLDFNRKYKADPSLRPRNEFYEKADLISQLKDCKTSLLIDIKDKDLMLLCKDMEFPQIGYLTRYEWLSFISVHILRHNHQIETRIK